MAAPKSNNDLLKLFVVVRTRGSAWQTDKSLEEQPEWAAHAAFMDAMAADGMAILVGPMEGTQDALIIARAHNAQELVERLEADPWSPMDMLRTTRVAPWQLRIGSLP